jgi:hypothetical protein
MNKPITFRPTKEVRVWYDKAKEGLRTELINQYLTEYIRATNPLSEGKSIDERLDQIERIVLSLQKLIQSQPWLK